jgi:hypothetical protein
VDTKSNRSKIESFQAAENKNHKLVLVCFEQNARRS